MAEKKRVLKKRCVKLGCGISLWHKIMVEDWHGEKINRPGWDTFPCAPQYLDSRPLLARSRCLSLAKNLEAGYLEV